jgi:hypothetical protein
MILVGQICPQWDGKGEVYSYTREPIRLDKCMRTTTYDEGVHTYTAFTPWKIRTRPYSSMKCRVAGSTCAPEQNGCRQWDNVAYITVILACEERARLKNKVLPNRMAKHRERGGFIEMKKENCARCWSSYWKLKAWCDTCRATQRTTERNKRRGYSVF